MNWYRHFPILSAGLILFSTSAVTKAVGVLPVLVSRVSGDDVYTLDIIHVGSQIPYGAKYAVEIRRKIERSWSFLTDNINISGRHLPKQSI